MWRFEPFFKNIIIYTKLNFNWRSIYIYIRVYSWYFIHVHFATKKSLHVRGIFPKYTATLFLASSINYPTTVLNIVKLCSLEHQIQRTPIKLEMLMWFQLKFKNWIYMYMYGKVKSDQAGNCDVWVTKESSEWSVRYCSIPNKHEPFRSAVC